MVIHAMTQALPNLIWLRSFESAARLLNFTEAATELGLTQAAISQHIRALETRLGTALFNRQPRNLSLTEMGRAYYPAVRKAIEDLTLSTTGLFGPALKRAVNLRAPISTAVLWIAPNLPDFHDHHPDVELRMISSIWADRLTETDVDIDLQLGNPDRFPRPAEWLCDETVTPICHPDQVAQYPAPSDLLHAPLIHILGFEDHWARYFNAHELNPGDATYGFSVDTTTAAMEMAAAGLGIAPVLTRFARQAMTAGRSVAMLSGNVALEQAHFMDVAQPGRRERPEVTAFRDWLRTQFS